MEHAGDRRAGRHQPAGALRALDAELAATVERLQRARVELTAILDRRATPELPADMVPASGASLSEADRSLALLMTRLMGPRKLAVYGELLRHRPSDPTDDEFDNLPGDAGEDVRRDLAERMAPHVRRVLGAYPGLRDPDDDAPRGARVLAETTAAAARELYNPAQRDVLVRMQALLENAS
ncbi:hypothetical protein [Pseudonocardia phyllosphaerae]|uniref:hypothetical protein n=1 Tax=Pseudonocardia phyllosphaerae TaxID=3390502 RepID=UPI00397C735B